GDLLRGFQRFEFCFLRIERRRLIVRAAENAAIPGRWPAMGGNSGPPGGLDRPGGLFLIIRGPKIYMIQKSRRPKDLLLLCFLKPHRLFRFLVGDHYGKGKSIRDDRRSAHGLAKAERDMSVARMLSKPDAAPPLCSNETPPKLSDMTPL